MQPSCPHCDQPDLSLLRLVLIGELLKADATWLLCLADVMQQCGLLPLAAEAEASEALRGADTDGHAAYAPYGRDDLSKCARGTGLLSYACPGISAHAGGRLVGACVLT